MPELELIFIGPLGQQPRKVPVGVAAYAAIMEMKPEIDKANGGAIPICVEENPRVQGAAVQISKCFGPRVIAISVGPTIAGFLDRLDVLLPHEMGHIYISSQGVPVLEPKVQGSAIGIKNSAIMDIADHPVIWQFLQRHGVAWNLSTREGLTYSFSDAYAAGRADAWKRYPHLTAKQFADYEFAAPELYGFIKSELQRLPKGNHVLRCLTEIEQVRAALGPKIYTVTGVKCARAELVKRWRHDCVKVDMFAD